MKKGKLIVIEGIDSSGKGTQLDLLKKRFKKLKKQVVVQDFPRYYESPWGKVVGEFLAGKLGKFESINPKLALFGYMLDQYTWGRDIGMTELSKGKTILLDRYFTSNVHQVAKLRGKSQTNFRAWLWPLGYKELKILRPDLVLFLDISPKFTKKMLKGKSERSYLNGKKKDGAEKNWDHQWASYKEYLRMTKTNKDWVRVECMAEGKLLTKEEIHNKVWEVVKKYI